jgi:hypothetical protein
MKRTIAVLGTALLMAGAAQAQNQRPGADVRPFVGFGVTFGGDRLESFDFSNGTSSDVRAGGLVDFRGGVDFLIAGPFSGQASVGYHFDSANGNNGDYTFSRVPLELIGYVSVAPSFRLGAGLRKSLDVRVESDGVVSGFDSNFKSNTGFILEGEYFPWQRVGIKVRYVNEKFTGKDGTYRGQKFDGAHGGIYGVYYFF